MKKFALGCSAFIAGSLGLAIWVLACVCNGGGGYSQILSYVTGSDYVGVVLYIVMIVAGLVISIREIKNSD